jgi:hypothetical protein
VNAMAKHFQFDMSVLDAVPILFDGDRDNLTLEMVQADHVIRMVIFLQFVNDGIKIRSVVNDEYFLHS